MTEVEQILSSGVSRNTFPSVQYYLFNEDKIISEAHFGFAKISEKLPVDTGTTYNAFSVTKTFTALAVLLLSEQGKLDIDQPVIRYLPEFMYGSQISVRQLLNHSAGIPNPMPLSWIHLEEEHAQFRRDEFFRKIFIKNNKIKSAPNEKFSYSNIGYVILGRLIETVSGKTYEQFVKESIINKLPVRENELAFAIKDNQRHATGYHKKYSFSNLVLGFFINKPKFYAGTEGAWKSFRNFYVNGTSYGGLIGTPNAFVKYIQEFIRDDSSLVSKQNKELLLSENVDGSGRSTGMCLSWFTGKLNGEQYFCHAGGGGGYYCEIRMYPGVKIGSVVFFNRTGMRDERYLDRLDTVYFQKQNGRH